MGVDTQEFVTEVGLWHETMYPLAEVTDILCKLTEEVGELCAALQGGKWSASREGRAHCWGREQDAVGDVMVVLAAYCHRRGIVLDEVVEATWREVQTRTAERVRNGNHGG